MISLTTVGFLREPSAAVRCTLTIADHDGGMALETVCADSGPDSWSQSEDVVNQANSFSPVTTMFVGGTGESFAGDQRTTPTGLLATVADALDGRFDCRWIGYPASYGPAPRRDGMSFTQSVAIGVDTLRAAIAGSTGPLTLVGYSQGAVVIRTALHQMWIEEDPALSRIVAAGFVADPHQPPSAVAGCTGWGVAGPGPQLPPRLPVRWVGAADDVICNADADSLVRDIADLTATISLTRLGDWLRSTWHVVRTNAFQNAGQTAVKPSQWRRDIGRLWAAWHAVRCYLPSTIVVGGLVIRNAIGGRHTSYRAEPYRSRSVTDPVSTGCEVIASWLQVQVTFAGIDGLDEPGTAA